MGDSDTGAGAVGRKLEGNERITGEAWSPAFIADLFTGDYFGDFPGMQEDFAKGVVVEFGFEADFGAEVFDGQVPLFHLVRIGNSLPDLFGRGVIGTLDDDQFFFDKIFEESADKLGPAFSEIVRFETGVLVDFERLQSDMRD